MSTPQEKLDAEKQWDRCHSAARTFGIWFIATNAGMFFVKQTPDFGAVAAFLFAGLPGTLTAVFGVLFFLEMFEASRLSRIADDDKKSDAEHVSEG